MFSNFQIKLTFDFDSVHKKTIEYGESSIKYFKKPFDKSWHEVLVFKKGSLGYGMKVDDVFVTRPPIGSID
jgi:hypothetical protein